MSHAFFILLCLGWIEHVQGYFGFGVPSTFENCENILENESLVTTTRIGSGISNTFFINYTLGSQLIVGSKHIFDAMNISMDCQRDCNAQFSNNPLLTFKPLKQIEPDGIDYLFHARYNRVQLSKWEGASCDVRRVRIVFPSDTLDTQFGMVFEKNAIAYNTMELLSIPIYYATMYSYKWNNTWMFAFLYYGIVSLFGIVFLRGHPMRISRICLLFSSLFYIASSLIKLHSLIVASTPILIPDAIVSALVTVVGFEWLPAAMSFSVFRYSRTMPQLNGLIGLILGIASLFCGAGFYVAPCFVLIGSILSLIVCIEIVIE